MADQKPSDPSATTDFGIDAQIKQWATNGVLAIAIALAAWAAINFIRHRKERSVGEEWHSFVKFESAARGGPTVTPVSLETVAEPLRPWAKLVEANRPLAQGGVDAKELEDARARFDALAKDASAGPAATGILGGNGLGAQAVAASIGQLDTWEKAHPQLLDNPAPDPAPRVKLVTDQGAIEIALYGSLAPKHVENFLKLAKEHFYEGMKFHRVGKEPQAVIEGGDPNSKEDKVETWGKGTLGDGIPVEKSRLANIRGAVGMSQPAFALGEKKSSGCQFYIVTANSPLRDGKFTVFGKVVSGLDVIDKIAGSPLAQGSERPATPTVITRVEVLQ